MKMYIDEIYPGSVNRLLLITEYPCANVCFRTGCCSQVSRRGSLKPTMPVKKLGKKTLGGHRVKRSTKSKQQKTALRTEKDFSVFSKMNIPKESFEKLGLLDQ